MITNEFLLPYSLQAYIMYAKLLAIILTEEVNAFMPACVTSLGKGVISMHFIFIYLHPNR